MYKQSTESLCLEGWISIFHDAIADDQELVMSMLEQDEPMHDSHTNEPEPTKLDGSIALDVSTTIALTFPIQLAMAQY